MQEALLGDPAPLSTSSACIMAICPAGPPKLTQPSLSQYQKALRRLTGDGGGEVACMAGGWLARMAGNGGHKKGEA
jgi:hypothetical protein